MWLSFVGGLLGGFLGAVATLLAARLREKGARREEWWRRVQWAADLALGDDLRRRAAGLNLLRKLVVSPLALNDDAQLLTIFTEPALSPHEPLPETAHSRDTDTASDAADHDAGGEGDEPGSS